MAKAQNRWHRKGEKMFDEDDCAAHRAFVAIAVIWRVQARTVQVLIYIKTWRRTGVQSVDRITSAWVALEWRTQ